MALMFYCFYVEGIRERGGWKEEKKFFSKYQTERELESCPAFKGIDFPAFEPVDTTFDATFMLEEYIISHKMRFKDVPAGDFYSQLESRCKTDSLWSKSEDGNTYLYDYSWSGTTGKGPDGWDYLSLEITKGKRDFSLSYGVE